MAQNHRVFLPARFDARRLLLLLLRVLPLF